MYICRLALRVSIGAEHSVMMMARMLLVHSDVPANMSSFYIAHNLLQYLKLPMLLVPLLVAGVQQLC